MQVAFVNTPLGMACLAGDANGLQSFTLSNSKEEKTEAIPESLKTAVVQIKEYFNKERQTFDLKLNPQGTEFQKKVWQELTKISYGVTTTYLKMAHQLGDPKCIRAAASANGKNPLWIIIPCHRVIGSDGSLTGYAGGLQCKQWLLEHEGAPIQQSLF